MSDLLLNSIRIVNFRAFRDLRIPNLGRVNLFVGRNNIGKTSVLEALWLYTRRGSPTVMRDILEARDETRLPSSPDTPDPENQALAIKYLFHGRREVGKGVETIQIGPIDAPGETLSIAILWHKQQVDEEGVYRLIPMQPDEYDLSENPVLGVISRIGSQTIPTRRLARFFERRTSSPASDINEIPNIFVPSNGSSKAQIANWRDRSVIEGKKSYVISALKIITSDVEDVDLISGIEYGRVNSTDRIPVVKLKHIDNYIPLRSLGDGMNRLFALTLALVNAQNGILIIDEIENGLHYSIQPDMWRLVMQVATDLNIQVFATTHSNDCVRAFSKVISENDEEGVLIRLGRKGENVVTTTFDEEELEIATEQHIEVR